MQTNSYRYCDYYNYDHIGWEQFHSYVAYEKHMCESTVAEMPIQKRWAFLGAVRTTFDALRLVVVEPKTGVIMTMKQEHEAQMLYSDFVKYLFSDDAKSKIAKESNRWMNNKRRICTDEIWFFLLMFETPFEKLYHTDPVLKYMLANISCACPMLQDITEACCGMLLFFAVACDGLRWHAVARCGLQWLAMACCGSRWLAVACDGLRWHAVSRGGLRWCFRWLAVACYGMCFFLCGTEIYFMVQVLYELNYIPANRTQIKRTFNRASLLCFPANTSARHMQKTGEEWIQWAFDVAAPAIAQTAFAIGWERTLRQIVREFAGEIINRSYRCRQLLSEGDNSSTLLHFLDRIVIQVDKLGMAEQDFYIAASIGLARLGFERDLVRKMLPCAFRYGGVPLLQMPRYLCLPPSHYPWRRHSSRR